jgi:hypothetical protein
MKLFFGLALACILHFFSPVAHGILTREAFDAMDWVKVDTKDGVIVYQAHKEAELRGLIPLRVTTELNHSMARIQSVLSDSSRKSEWVPHLEEARTVEILDQHTRVEYTRYSSPWPLSDRTFVVKIEANHDPVKKSIIVYMNSIAHPKVPEVPEHVRGETYFGRVQLTPVSENVTHFDMIFVTDFKGAIPVWVINMIQKRWPRKLVNKLDQQLKK